MQLNKPRTQFWLLVVLMAVLIGIGFLFDFDRKEWIEYFRHLTFPVAAILYVTAYVVITTLIWMTKDLLRIAGAIVFGPYWSTLFIWIGELVNAVIFFHLSRKLGRAYIEEKFQLKKVKLGTSGRKGGVWHIFLLRAFPFFPFRILDLAYGLSSVPFRKYLIVSAFAIPLRIFWVQFFVGIFFKDGVFDMAGGSDYLMHNLTVFLLSILYIPVSIATVVLLRRKWK